VGASQLEFGLLGSLLVRCDGVAVPVPPGLQRSLLAALLLQANTIVPAGELAEVLWGAEPPASALPGLRNVVLRLRRSLGDAGRSRIVAEPSGYQIRVEPGELDLDRFESLVASARDAARHGSHAGAGDLLREALSCWRGAALTGVPSVLLAARQVPRLEEMRLRALEARIDADLRAGRPAEVIVELRQLTAAHPLRERLHAMLMVALYRDGQQGGALAAYQAARRVLRDQLGAEPGGELSLLQQQILAGQLDAGPSADAQQSEAGQGRRPVPETPRMVPQQLPAAVPYFTGRAGELAELTGMLRRPHAGGTVVISAIAGMAGIGKTTLALHWAHQVAEQFPDGQLYVNLQGFGPAEAQLSPSAALRLFLGGLGVPREQIPVSLEAQAALYRGLLAGRRVLIVLDNAREPAQVRPLLPGVPGCLTLVTSRDRLAGLAAGDGARVLTLDVLTEPEAHEMLALRLGRDRAGAESLAVAELTELCARLPLALSVVAARAGARPGLPLATVAAEVRAHHTRLDALDTGDAATDLRTVLSWSVRQLGESPARMFRLLSVHPGPDITVPAAASLAAVPRPDAEQALRELARSNLVAEQPTGRFGFHDLLRAYAAEQAAELECDAGRRAALHRVLDHYLYSVTDASQLLTVRKLIPLSPMQPGVAPEQPGDQEQAVSWLRAERQVILAAISHAAECDLLVHAWQLPWAMAIFLRWYGYWHDFVAVQEQAVAAAEQLSDLTAQAVAHRYLGMARGVLFGDDDDDALVHSAAAAELAAKVGDDTLQAVAWLNVGCWAEAQGDIPAAIGHTQRAGQLYRQAGDRWGEAIVLRTIGWLQARLGDYHRALDLCCAALEIFRELGVQIGQSVTMLSIAHAHVQLGQYAEAISYYQQATEIDKRVGDQRGRAEIFTHLGDAHEAAGNQPKAVVAWQQALDILRQLSDADSKQVRDRLAGGATARRVIRPT
jgi:DNA-binding SARP family transcriptional activator/tetratricopeptide (TPR) repeat protein